jgi:hypothetical protein
MDSAVVPEALSPSPHTQNTLPSSPPSAEVEVDPATQALDQISSSLWSWGAALASSGAQAAHSITSVIKEDFTEFKESIVRDSQDILGDLNGNKALEKKQKRKKKKHRSQQQGGGGEDLGGDKSALGRWYHGVRVCVCVYDVCICPFM